jgi:hypothetical protein
VAHLDVRKRPTWRTWRTSGGAALAKLATPVADHKSVGVPAWGLARAQIGLAAPCRADRSSRSSAPLQSSAGGQ